MSLVLFAWMTDQQYFKELTNINTLHHLRDKTDEEMENDMFTFFVTDGRSEPDIPDVIDLTDRESMMENRDLMFF